MLAPDAADIPDESNTRPLKRFRYEGTNTTLSESPNFAFSSTQRVNVHHESRLPDCPNMQWTLELGPASLPPRYRRQWNKHKDLAVLSRNDIRKPSPNPPSPRGLKEIDVIDLTKDTDTEDDSVVECLDNDRDHSSSEMDTESDGSSPDMTPVVANPTEFDISTMPLDLEHLNASARGVMNNAPTSKHEIKRGHRNPRRGRLISNGASAPHTPEGTHVVPLPKSAYNTARRVLVPESRELPLVTVSMRADIQFFHQSNRYRLSKYSLPNQDSYRHVVDATMISETAIVAYGAGPTQISLVQLIEGHRPSLIDLNVRPHSRSSDPHKRGATITCLSPSLTSSRKVIRFFTGGYDKAIRLWSVNYNKSESTELFKTSAIPEALEYRTFRRSVLVATSKKLLELELDHLTKKPAQTAMSNAIHQLHVDKEVESITILEVDSLDHQIHLYDDRAKNGFDRTSDCSFGRRGRISKHSKGDTRGSLFAKGYDDGTVCVWDLRNVKHPIRRKIYHQLGSVIHTTFSNMDLVCYGKSGLTFLDISTTDSC